MNNQARGRVGEGALVPQMACAPTKRRRLRPWKLNIICVIAHPTRYLKCSGYCPVNTNSLIMIIIIIITLIMIPITRCNVSDTVQTLHGAGNYISLRDQRIVDTVALSIECRLFLHSQTNKYFIFGRLCLWCKTQLHVSSPSTRCQSAETHLTSFKRHEMTATKTNTRYDEKANATN